MKETGEPRVKHAPPILHSPAHAFPHTSRRICARLMVSDRGGDQRRDAGDLKGQAVLQLDGNRVRDNELLDRQPRQSGPRVSGQERVRHHNDDPLQ